VSWVCAPLTSKSTRRLQKDYHGGDPSCTDDVTLSGAGFVSENCPALLVRVRDPRVGNYEAALPLPSSAAYVEKCAKLRVRKGCASTPT
jgi:hypothetical protein